MPAGHRTVNLSQAIVGAVFWCCVMAIPLRAQPCTDQACGSWFPDESGAINARHYGARGDGHTDDTAALLAAIAASGGDTGRAVWHDRIVFLPAGKYVVSAPLWKRYSNGAFASGMILIGESPKSTIIQLKDHAPGFANRSSPRAVIMTSSKLLDTRAGRDYDGRGEGNDAYENFVQNLTIDVGRFNPGAIGIDYLANNLGAIRDVVVQAPEGEGAIGIAMLRKWPGPALLQRVSVLGFDVGMAVGHTEYGVTLSQVHLGGQSVAGLINTDNMVAAEDLRIDGTSGTAVINRTNLGMILLKGGALGTPSLTGMTIDNHGIIILDGTALPRDAGLPAPIQSGGVAYGWLQGRTDWHSQIPAWSAVHPLAPVIAAGPRAGWVGVASDDDDDAPTHDSTAALRAAFASAATVYLRHGTFWLSAPLEVPPGLHRLIGMNATLRINPASRAAFPREQGLLRILTPGQPLAIEHLALDNTDQGNQVGIELNGSRTLLLRDVFGAGVVTLARRGAGGAAFIEDTCCGTIEVAGGAPVVARQLNTEGSGIRIFNHGAPLTILGLKTEADCTAVSSEAGAFTEVFGGLLYMVREPEPLDVPAFSAEDSNLMARFVEESLQVSSHYATYLRERRQGIARDVPASNMPARGLGHTVPLLWAGEPPR